MFLIYIIFVFIYFSFYSMESVDNSFICDRGSLVSNQVKIQYSTATGKCQPSHQEDRIAVRNDARFFSLGVFDGHGGSQTAEILADQTTGLLNALHNNALLNEETITKVYTEYDKSNEQEIKRIDNSGSTAVTVTFDSLQKELFLANCGDSIGLLIQDKKILYWTIPHDAKIKTEVERINQAQGFWINDRVKGRINMTRAFGDYDIRGGNYICGLDDNNHSKLIISDPSIFKSKLEQQPIIGLLCSDGFTNYFCYGVGDLSSENIHQKLLMPLKDIICKLIECGRPISGLAFDLVCLMNWNKSVNTILKSIKKDMDWETIKDESSSFQSNDNVSVVVFEIAQNNEESIIQNEGSCLANNTNTDNLNLNLITTSDSIGQPNLGITLTDNHTAIGNGPYDSIIKKINEDSNDSLFGQDSHVDNNEYDKVSVDNQSSKNFKNLSLFSRIFNYARSYISFKGMCLATFGFFLTAYIIKQVFHFKNI